MNPLLIFVRRQAEIASSFGVLLGGAAAVIIFFGGSIPPWYTPEEARADQATVAKIQQSTVQTLSKLNDQMNSVQRRLDQADCSNLQHQLDQANSVLIKAPDDPLARTLRDNVESQMHVIQNCLPL